MGIFHAYLLYMICYAVFTILIDLHSQKWMNTSLFEFTIYLSHALKHIYIFPDFSQSDISYALPVFVANYM